MKLPSLRFALFGTCLLSSFAWGQSSVSTLQTLSLPTLDALNRAKVVGHADPNQKIYLTVGLPYANQQAIEDFNTHVSTPGDPLFHQYLTPEEVGAQFGLPQANVDAVATYLHDQGFTVTLVAKNRLSVMVEGTVAAAEKAFGTTINNYSILPWAAPTEPGRTAFYANATPLKFPSNIAPFIQNVSGIQNYTKPQKRNTLTPDQQRVLYNSAPIYNAKMQGQGRATAISSWDGYRLSNVPVFYSTYGLPTPSGGVGSNITVYPIQGGSGAGNPGGEGDLDIQMVLATAPLSNFYIYDGGGDLASVLTQEANDNTADIISESYGWNLDGASATQAHSIHLSMTAQGITYMAATGDNGTTLEPYSYPNYEPEVLQVGGTSSTTDSAGHRITESGWSGSGGGWSTNSASFNKRPSWQKGKGVLTNVNFRMCPDVSLQATGGNGGAYWYVYGGSVTNDADGTSFACPVFCGGLAVAEQKLIVNGALPANKAGKRRLGRIQDVVYSQNGRPDVWFDVLTGNNGKLPDGTNSICTTGWDTVTGWGPINWDNFVSTLLIQLPPAPTITSSNPVAVGVGSGDQVLALTGVNFLKPTTTVWTSAAGATTSLVTTYVSGTRINVVLPGSLITSQGTGTITATTINGPSNAYSIPIAPNVTVSSITPTSTKVNSSLRMTINGAGFTTGCKVQIGSLQAATIYVSGTQLQANIPPSSFPNAGTFPVSIISSKGVISNSVNLTVH